MLLIVVKPNACLFIADPLIYPYMHLSVKKEFLII